MKKNKLIGLVAMSLSLSLTGCDLSWLFPTEEECVHDYGPWETTQPATCLTKGSREKICSKCGDSKTQPIKADPTILTNHRWEADPDADSIGDCEHPSVTGSKRCVLCGEKLAGEMGELPDHKWVRVETSDPKYRHNDNNVDATCDEDGLVYSKCSACGKYDDVTVKALGHEANSTVTRNDNMNIYTCKRCSKPIAYEFEIKDATGFHLLSKPMNSTTSPENKASWDIENKLEPGSYNVEIEALMPTANDGNRKWYNMAKPVYCVDGKAEDTTSTGDKSSQSSYRYTIKIDGKEFAPQGKESWNELGLASNDVGGKAKYVKFVDNVNVDSDSKELSLVHGSIGYPLYITKVKFVPHEHVVHSDYQTGYDGRVTYSLEECDCGFRRITITAKDSEAILNDGSQYKETDVPEGYMKLKSNNDSISYKFIAYDTMVADIYMVGRQDSYPNNAQSSPYNCEWSLNGKTIPIRDKTLKCSKFFGSQQDPAMESYSPLGRVPVNEVSLVKNELNTLTFKRTGSYNIAMSSIVIEGRVVDHVHSYTPDHTKDQPATCSQLKQDYSACTCGEVQWTQDTTSTLAACSYTISLTKTDATCTKAGSETQMCQYCGATRTIITEPSHKFYTDTELSTDEYTVQVCSACHEKTITWSLKEGMVQDLVEGNYVNADTTFKGKMADGKTDVSLYKFENANRRIVLQYNNTGEAKNVTLKLLATAKTPNKTQVYKQTTGVVNSYDKFILNVNGEQVTYSNDVLDTTLDDLGVDKNVNCSISADGGKLPNPVWIDFYTITLKAGMNTIIVESQAPVNGEDPAYPAFIGGIGFATKDAEN